MTCVLSKTERRSIGRWVLWLFLLVARTTLHVVWSDDRAWSHAPVIRSEPLFIFFEQTRHLVFEQTRHLVFEQTRHYPAAAVYIQKRVLIKNETVAAACCCCCCCLLCAAFHTSYVVPRRAAVRITHR